jgi:alkyl hydroperoxide reductase subunit D
MAFLTPVEPASAPEPVAQTYGRIQEMFGGDLPEMFLVYGNVESFLKDFYMNFKKFVYSSGALDEKTRAIIALVVACHSKCPAWVQFFQSRAVALGWSKAEVAEAMAVAATNYCYNTFFKFRDLSGSGLFEGMGVGLRAHTFTSVSLDQKLVELINIAVSDINACKPCTSGHVDKSRSLGLSDEQILECIQCASTMYAGCQFLNAAEC